MQIKEFAIEERNTEHAKKLLVGKTIKDVVYLSHMDIEEMLWSKRPLMIIFDDVEDFVDFLIQISSHYLRSSNTETKIKKIKKYNKHKEHTKIGTPNSL